ncbi:MAG: 4-hydroxy-tetrahydrodipicolinate synthase [Parachlamydiaceae bacterium]|nr:4-hydroxy-tetrahydrodipicolinate synthase [Parachlamydiaceae bacterium]
MKGTITALVTPFINNKFDEQGFRNNIRSQIAAGIDGIVPLGSTGESSTLSTDEQGRIIEVAVEEAKGKIQVWIGTGSYCTRQTIEKTKRAQDLGADAAMIVTPYYNRPTQEGIFRHFEAIATNTDIPIIVYNIPGRCSTNIETSTMMRIAALPNIVGLKEASGNMNQAGDILQALGEKFPDFKVYSGDDIAALPMIALGAAGVVSVVSNLIPKDVVELVDASLEGNFVLARKLHRRLLSLYKVLFIETNPVPIKTAMHLCGLIQSGECRLPLYSMIPENLDLLSQLLDEMEITDAACCETQQTTM